jgi:hypothetical protein
VSSTKRGATRSADDLYETPEWFTAAAYDELSLRLPPGPLTILEPAAGTGRMVKVIRKMFPDDTLFARDLNGFEGAPGVDFLKSEPEPEFDLIITNPPFSYAQEFIDQALACRKSRESVVAMVLRLNFLGSIKRAAWFRQRMPDVYVTPKRPKFVPKGMGEPGKSYSDSCEYAWFIWQEPFTVQSRLGMLNTEHAGPMFGFSEEMQTALARQVELRRKAARSAVIPFD